MKSGPSIVTKFLADTTDLKSGVDKGTDAAGSKIESFAKKAAAALGTAFAVTKVVQFGQEAVTAASDLAESASKVGVVFGDQAGEVEAFAKTAVTALGLSRQAALEATGTFGNFLIAMGNPKDAAKDMSIELVKLASDLASFNNANPEDVLLALRSGLSGEAEPLRKFGVSLSAARVEAEGMSVGINKAYKDMTAAEKSTLSYQVILNDTSMAQGDFARTSEGLANQQRIANAKMQEFKATIGAALIPALLVLTTLLTDKLLPAFVVVFNWIGDHKDIVLAALIGFGTIVGGVVIPAFIAWAVAAGAAAIATIAAAAPFIAIGAVIAAVAYVIIHNWDTIVAATTAAWDAVVGAVRFVFNWIRDNWPLLLAVITGPIGVATLLIVKNWDTIKDAAGALYDWIKGKFEAIAGVIGSVVGAIAGAVGKVVDAIRAPINFLVDAWNGLAFTIPRIEIPSVEILGKTIGGQGFGPFQVDFPDLPRLAAGGVLTAPTLFVGGEAGTEIVSPEALLRQIVAEEGGGRYTLNIYPRTADAADIAYGFRRLELLAGVG